MKKKGFTLVELLAVIAILAILVVIAVPRIRKVYEDAEKNSFLVEAKSAYETSKKKYIMYHTQGKDISEFVSDSEYSLDLENKAYKYCIELNRDGSVSRLQFSDGKYYIKINGDDKLDSYTIDNLEKKGYESLYCIVDESRSLKNVILKDNKAYPENRDSSYVYSDKGIDFSKSASNKNGFGLYYNYNSDDINLDGKIDKRYYFRGNVTNNNVILGGSCYKILGISEDGAVRMLYNGEAYNNICINGYADSISSAYYNDNNDYNGSVGYKFGVGNSSSYDNEHKNTNDSNIKEIIEEWYSNNLSSYSSIIQDTVYCNDRSVSNEESEGFSHIETSFLANSRINKKSNPTFKCSNQNDKFSVSTSIGNGKLKYPIATLTADEYIYSGGIYGYPDESMIESYKPDLYNNIKLLSNKIGLTAEVISPYGNNNTFINVNGWTMTPSTTGKVFAFLGGSIFSSNVDNNDKIYPVISLSPKALVKMGEGFNDNPYVIDIDRAEERSKCLSASNYKKGTLKYKMLINSCAYSDNVASRFVNSENGIDYEYSSGKVIPMKYKSYSYNNWSTYFGSASTYKFYKDYIFNEKDGTYKLSGDYIEGKWNTSSTCNASSCKVAGYYIENSYNSIKKIISYSSSTYGYTDYYSSSITAYGWNGNGLYYSNNKDLIVNDVPILYYRGNISNNYVMLNNNCFRIVRTDEFNNIKLVYNNAGKCQRFNTGINTEYNHFSNDNAYVGYMYGTLSVNESPKYESRSFSASSTFYFGSEYKFDYNTLTFKIAGDIKSGKWGTEDICYSTTNCAVKNYYTCLYDDASKSCSQILKSDGFSNTTWSYSSDPPGTIRGYYANFYRVGYTSSSYSSAHANINSSVVKQTLDKWYKDNNFDKVKSIADAVYCNDRSLYSGLGYGFDYTYYAYYGRPLSFKCAQNNDKFSVSSVIGNGKLKYPVALLTADEMYASGNLFSGYGFSMTPYYNFSVKNDYSDSASPTITIGGDTYISQGNGTVNDPYLIKE